MKRFLPYSLFFVFMLCSSLAFGQEYPMGSVVGDAMPTAPELSKRGEYSVGVRTLIFTDKGRLDALKVSETEKNPLYDRVLKVEVWYPAELTAGTTEITLYTEHLGRADQNNLKPFEFAGRAVRDAVVKKAATPYPFVLISHGYPGSRYMLSYLAENLASKGYVVAAIGHMESTYEDVSGFASTLVNRSLDQIFILDKFEELAKSDAVFKNAYDIQNTAVLGYSMGGYGTMRTIGASYSEAITGATKGAGTFLTEAMEPDWKGDNRVKAAVLFAPWGGAGKYWTESALEKIVVPTLWIAGTEDDIANYASIVEVFEKVKNSDRYFLIYEDARHNPAPNAPPMIDLPLSAYLRWAEPAWDERKINNINQHFVTAFLDTNLKKDESKKLYLEVLVEESNKGVYSLNQDGTPKENHTYWKGFAPRTAVGLQLLHR